MTNLIRQWNGRVIRQRQDGYLSATDMCQSCGKLFGNWMRLDSTKEYLKALESRHYSDLNNGQIIEANVGGSPETTGTWVYRKVAIRLAQWLSPEFAVQVDDWIEELLTNGKVELSTQSPSQNLKEQIEIISHCLSISDLSPNLIAGVALNFAEKRMPELKAGTDEARKLLAANNPIVDTLLTPTAIGEQIGISAIKVNKLLINAGLQTKNPNYGKRGHKGEPSYLPTDRGSEFCDFTLATGRMDDSSYQHLKWYPSVIAAIG